MKKISPKLDILPPAQRIIWPLLTDIPQHFVLCGGTALALQFGHRESVDYDFFTTIDIFAMKVMTIHRRFKERDWVDIGELIKQGYSLKNAFANARALAKRTSLPDMVTTKITCNDILGSYFEKNLPENRKDLVAIIQEAAAKIGTKEVERIEKRRVKIYKSLSEFSNTGLGR